MTTASTYPPAAYGSWELLQSNSQILPVHAALLHTGKVLYFAGSGNDPAKTRGTPRIETRIWDPATHGIRKIDTERDLFCCGHSFLADGRLLAAGGNLRYYPLPLFPGLRDTHLFDPIAERWDRVQDMADVRWYPTCVTLPTGEVLVGAGFRTLLLAVLTLRAYARRTEVFDPTTGTWRTLRGANIRHPLYPRFHLLPTGKVFCSGPGRTSHLFHRTGTGAGEWHPGPKTNVRRRLDGTSVLLPLERPPPSSSYRPRVLIVGGGRGYVFRRGGTRTAELIDFGEEKPSWHWIPPMVHERKHVNAVLLPDGKVLVVGGGRAFNGDPVLDPEMFDPKSILPGGAVDPERPPWTLMAPMHVGRLYHSVALLLPDGRVWTAGGNPAQGDDELRMELYSPPYLFRGDRPRIENVAGEVAYRQETTIDTPDAAAVDRVVLIRPSAVTHSFNMTQRLVVLETTARRDDSLRVRMPPDGRIAPPGYYLLFLVTAAGVPSEGRFLRLHASPRAPSPAEPTEGG